MSGADILAAAVAAAAASDAATAALATLLREALHKRLHDGVVIDIAVTRETPEYLRSVRTVKGNDRGTRRFRLVGSPDVEVIPRQLTGAKWECRAVPVSEKTGKDMSAATHGADSRDTVRLRGGIFATWAPSAETEDDSSRLQRFLGSVDQPTETAS